MKSPGRPKQRELKHYARPSEAIIQARAKFLDRAAAKTTNTTKIRLTTLDALGSKKFLAKLVRESIGKLVNARVRRRLEALEAIRPNYLEFSEGDMAEDPGNSF